MTKLVAKPSDELSEAFPSVDPGLLPLGSRILVQIRTPKTRSAGGIILTADTRATEHDNSQVARIVALGPLAFKNRNTLEPWPEGAWCVAGDFVRVSKYGGDRFEVPVGDEYAVFVVLNDLDIIGKVTGDPLSVRAFI